jgi:hypothetical protein
MDLILLEIPAPAYNVERERARLWKLEQEADAEVHKRNERFKAFINENFSFENGQWVPRIRFETVVSSDYLFFELGRLWRELSDAHTEFQRAQKERGDL